MKIYRILGNKGNTTVPWQIRDAMDLRASDVISFEYGQFGEDVIVLRRELCADGGLDDCANIPVILKLPTEGSLPMSLRTSLTKIWKSERCWTSSADFRKRHSVRHSCESCCFCRKTTGRVNRENRVHSLF